MSTRMARGASELLVGVRQLGPNPNLLTRNLNHNFIQTSLVSLQHIFQAKQPICQVTLPVLQRICQAKQSICQVLVTFPALMHCSVMQKLK